VSTTVDEALLVRAREVMAGANDATLLDEALQALLRRHRATEVDGAYEAYDKHPPSRTPGETWHRFVRPPGVRDRLACRRGSLVV
jgi:hypothetical protein